MRAKLITLQSLVMVETRGYGYIGYILLYLGGSLFFLDATRSALFLFTYSVLSCLVFASVLYLVSYWFFMVFTRLS